MKPNVGVNRRSSIRLQDYDYSRSGAYFITIVTHGFKCRFGRLEQGEIVQSAEGRIAFDEWFLSSSLRNEIELQVDEFVVMPNHIHGIVWIEGNRSEALVDGRGSDNPVRATGRLPIQLEEDLITGPRPRSLSAFVAGYKSAVTRRINQLKSSPGKSVWKRNFHDRIIRNQRELSAIRKYIQENPAKWELDQHFID